MANYAELVTECHKVLADLTIKRGKVTRATRKKYSKVCRELGINDKTGGDDKDRLVAMADNVRQAMNKAKTSATEETEKDNIVQLSVNAFEIVKLLTRKK